MHDISYRANDKKKKSLLQAQNTRCVTDEQLFCVSSSLCNVWQSPYFKCCYENITETYIKFINFLVCLLAVYYKTPFQNHQGQEGSIISILEIMDGIKIRLVEFRDFWDLIFLSTEH